mmetsp:Transcript_10940/g.18291  ORF Transcript_10940/g.18291 Transcript_10940/m.18291 type:complete len:109 (-) Transcript_10940:944-1270(-)
MSQIVVECNVNQECQVMGSYCCSDHKCVKSTFCYNGFKRPNDNCDFSYECFSRCCDPKTGTCTSANKCLAKCQQNDDCSTNNSPVLHPNPSQDFPCCSNGYCTNPMVC